jgi:hypothetical protein
MIRLDILKILRVSLKIKKKELTAETVNPKVRDNRYFVINTSIESHRGIYKNLTLKVV